MVNYAGAYWENRKIEEGKAMSTKESPMRQVMRREVCHRLKGRGMV